MENSATPPQQAILRRPQRGTFYILQVVLGVAFILATLFTAWTDPGLFPSDLRKNLTAGLGPQVTSQPIDASTPTPRTKPLIGIVAGHSGNDSGAVCPDGQTEVSVNEAVAAYVKQYLVERGYDVDILKEFDDRLNGYMASTLISIHADSCDYINDLATGFKVSAPLANPHPDQAARLTACLRNRYAQKTGLALHNSITNDMTSYHAFSEINGNTPAAIIEVGFLNLDRAILTQKPDILAQGITDGIVCFLNNENISNETATPTP
jgi:N-acetylmuramoyl-L-alanine amidase